MKKMIAVVVAGLFVMAAAAPADARGPGGGGGHGGSGGHGGGGFRGGRFHGHHFHGHGFRSSVVIGGYWGPYWDPFWYPAYYPYAPYYPYEPVPVATEPQTYIEQSGPSYWYYCEGAKAYYPYVRECPGGWLTVLPQGAPEPKP
ncbi:MAG TPA: hypothetical protein VK548_08245 [Candidatus Acidoferrum sp.]|nr:hypothetical protein [Candidatus Acidoferrum sp.]